MKPWEVMRKIFFEGGVCLWRLFIKFNANICNKWLDWVIFLKEGQREEVYAELELSSSSSPPLLSNSTFFFLDRIYSKFYINWDYIKKI